MFDRKELRELQNEIAFKEEQVKTLQRNLKCLTEKYESLYKQNKLLQEIIDNNGEGERDVVFVSKGDPYSPYIAQQQALSSMYGQVLSCSSPLKTVKFRCKTVRHCNGYYELVNTENEVVACVNKSIVEYWCFVGVAK